MLNNLENAQIKILSEKDKIVHIHNLNYVKISWKNDWKGINQNGSSDCLWMIG